MAHLAGQLAEKPANHLQNGSSLGCQAVFTARAEAAINVAPASQPPPRLHPAQHGVERAGADAIAMFAKLLEHPLPHDGPFGGMVQDVDLPEAQEDLTPGGSQVVLRSPARRAWSSHLAQYCAFRYRNQ